MSFILFFVIPTTTVFLLMLGIYKLAFEQKIQAKENIIQVMQPHQQAAPIRNVEILRKRRASEATFTGRLELKLERANWALSAKEFMIMAILLGVLTFIVLEMTGKGFMPSVLGGVGAYYVLFLLLNAKIWLRMKKASDQFPNILDAMVNCFKTGYGFSRSLQIIADNFQDPWGTEFAKMSIELNLGVTMEEALSHLKKRIPLVEVELFVSAMLIQKETGGNLAELLETLSATCRSRQKLMKKVQAISAQGQLSAGVICLVPFIMGGIMYTSMPEDTVAFYTHPIGIVLVVLVGIWMAFGMGVLYKIVNIEV